MSNETIIAIVVGSVLAFIVVVLAVVITILCCNQSGVPQPPPQSPYPMSGIIVGRADAIPESTN
jgi:hypothetical protein